MSKLSSAIRKSHHHFCTAVVVAAGNSSRMGDDKLVMDLGGTPVLALTLSALNGCDAVDELIVVTKPERLDYIAELKERFSLGKLSKAIIGGATRTESALAGVCEADRRAKIICIHDGARPFVTPEIVDDAVHNAVLYLAAAPAVPVKDTLKLAEGGTVTGTPDRESLFAVQTPQAFQADIIKAALTAAVRAGRSYTDDCAAAEAIGATVHLSCGSEENIKITTPIDLEIAEVILARRRGAQI